MIYLDNSATTKPHDEVLQSYVTVARNYFGNPSSLHGLGSEAERLLSQSRSITAGLLGVKPTEIIFTSGGTEGNNLAIKGTAIALRSRGKHVITTTVEHASVSEAFKQLELLGFEVTYLPVDEYGLVSVESIREAIRNDTILVSILHVNNETGAIQPIQAIGELLRQYPKLRFHVDHVQGVGKVPLSFTEAHIDLCTISGHKFHGVKGTGILYVREGVVLDPILSGGQQEYQYRSGTENLPGIVATAKALRMTMESANENRRQLEEMKQALLVGVADIPQAVLNTMLSTSAPHIVNVSFPGLKPEVLVHALEERGVFVSTKSACSSKVKEASHVLLEMGKGQHIAESAIRMSLSPHNTMAEIQQVQGILQDIIPKLYEVTR